MKSVLGMICGVVAGAIGAGIWAAISYNTGYEIGWIAWIIGGLVGFAVALGSQEEVGLGTGIAAGIIALGSVVGGKYATIRMALDDFVNEEEIGTVSEEDLIVTIADQIVAERVDAGQTIDWPGEWQFDEATEQADYPADIWSEASERWTTAGPDWQDQHRTYVEYQVAQNIASFKDEASEGILLESLGILDALFFLLAVATAYQVGSGGTGGGDE